MKKLNCFILLMVLVNLSWAQTTPVDVVAVGLKDNSGIKTNTEQPKDATTCSTPGLYADASNCQLYQECVSTGSADGSLQLVTKSCKETEAFCDELKRCSREISSCKPPVQCRSKGVIPHPNDKTSYYFCQPKFSNSDFFIFRIYCGENEVFYPNFGGCLSNPEESLVNGANAQFNNTDILIIRAEINNLKQQFKEELVQEKVRQRMG